MSKSLEQRVAELERLVAALDRRTSSLRRYGPLPQSEPDTRDLREIIDKGLDLRKMKVHNG